MTEVINSLLIFLSIWFKELKHDIKGLLKNKILFIVSMGFAAFFLLLFFVGFYRILNYVKGTPIVGMALVSRLVGTVFLALFTMLIYSSIITAFSTLYFSDDNDFLITSPFDRGGIILGKLIQTVFFSSWMSLLVLIPLFIAIGIVFKLSLISYLIITPGILLYFFTATSLGMSLVIFIVKIFPARRTRDLLILGLVILGTSLYVLLRLLNLEQILRPGQGSLVASYLSVFELPRTIYLPSYWMSKVAIQFINKRSQWLMPFLILMMMGIIAVAIYYIISKKFFYSGWEKIQSDEKKRYVSKTFPKNPLLAKDTRAFFRDPRQWTQLLLIGALIVVYIFNIYKMPLDIPYIHYLIAFLNIGLIGFVIAAVSLRFSFSAISLEGKYLWLLLSSPFDIKKMMKLKYIENLIPIEILALTLVIIANYILKTPGLLNILSIVTVIVSGISITSLGIGLGALYPKFDVANPEEIETSWGGIIYMIYSLFYIGITLSLEAVWVRMYFLNKIRNTEIYYPAVVIIILLLVLLNVLVNVIPLKLGLRNLKMLEFIV